MYKIGAGVKQNWSWSMKETNFQGGGRRFQGKNITSSTVSGHISSTSKRRAGERLSIHKTVVFKRDVNKNSIGSSRGRISHFLVNWQKLTLN